MHDVARMNVATVRRRRPPLANARYITKDGVTTEEPIRDTL
jgi:hypothetical protein